MKAMICVLSLFFALPVFAENFVGGLKNQSVQVLGEEAQPTSCRLYRKRVDMFLQRQDEVAMAASLRDNRLGATEARRLMDLIQRADLPLDLQKEKIIWTLDFDISQAPEFLNGPSPLVEIESTYLHWRTSEGFFPDHFLVQLSPDLQTARVTYKMTYMEACLAPISIALRISSGDQNSVQMQTVLDRNLF